MGHPQTPEARAKIGAATRARWQDTDYRANMSRHYWRNRVAMAAGSRLSRDNFISRREAARRLGTTRHKVMLMIEEGLIHTEMYGGRRCILAWEFWRAFRLSPRPPAQIGA